MTSDPAALQPAVKPSAGTPRTFQAWLRLARRHQTPLLAVLAALAVVCASALVWIWHGRQSADQAFQMLAVARAPAQWEEIIQQHPRTPAAPLALLALANAQYHNGAYDAAVGTYRQFQTRYPRHNMALAAELGLALCREARGETAEALADFERLLAAHPGHYLAPQALFGKARCLARRGDFAGARAVYENFVLENPESSWNSQAEMALTMLQRAARAASAAPAADTPVPAITLDVPAESGPAITLEPAPVPATDS